MARKMNKKTRNVISGILVGIASIAAVINFADLPARDAGRFLLSTAIFFLVIVLLALVTVSIFKLIGFISAKITGEDKEDHVRSSDSLSGTFPDPSSDPSSDPYSGLSSDSSAGYSPESTRASSHENVDNNHPDNA